MLNKISSLQLTNCSQLGSLSGEVQQTIIRITLLRKQKKATMLCKRSLKGIGIIF